MPCGLNQVSSGAGEYLKANAKEHQIISFVTAKDRLVLDQLVSRGDALMNTVTMSTIIPGPISVPSFGKSLRPLGPSRREFKKASNNAVH